MGCDIHCYVEIKHKGKTHNYWRKVGDIFPYEYYDKNSFPDKYNNEFNDEPEIGRNYDLFSIFAGVRNGTWGERVIPISEPRGLPKDVSDEIKEKSDKMGEDGHSHSYLTLEEIENYDWEKKIKHSAYVSKKQKEEFEKTGKKPDSYAAWSSVGVKIEWEETLKETVGRYFFSKIIPQLKALEKWGKVRLVFWFDN